MASEERRSDGRGTEGVRKLCKSRHVRRGGPLGPKDGGGSIWGRRTRTKVRVTSPTGEREVG